MKRLKPIMKSIIYGLLIFAGSTYAARTYYANDVVYANKSGINITVDDALNDLYYASSNFANPTGTVISVMKTKAPEGYLMCDGKTYNISDYPKLAKSFKEDFGSSNYFGGNGETTFAVPDLRGEFLRGTGTNNHSNQGSGANVGIHQNATSVPYLAQANASWLMVGVYGSNTTIQNPDTYYGLKGYGQLYNITGYTSQTDVPGQSLTVRPTNTSVLYCIKY